MLIQWLDERIAGLPHLSYLPKGESLAYFPNELLKCVVFIGYKNEKDEYKFMGSGFWVVRSVPDDLTNDWRPVYLVTAAHVIMDIKNKTGGDKVWLRINTKSDGQKWIETPLQFWKMHPAGASVDLAIIKLGIDASYDHRAWPLDSSVLNDKLDTDQTGNRKVELGDELCFAGLFHPCAGQKRNIPIVRTGTVAALRSEPIANKDGTLMDVYLADSHSIGGLSGSPVFIDIKTEIGRASCRERV
jgi:hypothetical protein